MIRFSPNDFFLSSVSDMESLESASVRGKLVELLQGFVCDEVPESTGSIVNLGCAHPQT